MPFDPLLFSFVRLRNFSFPGDVAVYELASHTCVNGMPDLLRLNTYLSVDGAFVTIWYGLLEPVLVDEKLIAVEWHADLSLAAIY
jgi:hypothetical protein